MIENPFTIFILIFFIAPISLLFHEVGHAVGAKLVRASTIQLTIGTGRKILTISVGNMTITVRMFFVINSFTSTDREEPFRAHEKIITTLLGPVFSGLLGCMFFILYNLYSGSILYLFFLFNIWLFVVNLLPLKIGQKKSDGYTICKMLTTRIDE